MKKTFYIIVLGLLWLVWFTRADVNSVSVTPVTQSAISGSLVTFTVTWTNGSGDVYLKYILPQTATYDIAYQNANLTPINNALLMLGTEHNPVFLLTANSNFSVTITAKAITPTRILPTIDTTAVFAADIQISTILTSAIAQITPIADLMVMNILTGMNPSFSGDNVSYYITLQNIWSDLATGITFISTFPIPTLATPTATFNGVAYAYNYINYPQDFVWTGTYLDTLNAGQTITILLNAPLMQSFAIGTQFNQIAKTTTVSTEYTTGNNFATATGIVQASADMWINKTLTPFTGYAIGDKVFYTLNYGNSWGKVANDVTITDIVSTGIFIPVTSFTIGTLPTGSGGTIRLTWTLLNVFMAGQTFVNTANISTTSIESTTGNNHSTATWTVQMIGHVTLDIIANNLTRPQYDNIPYGSGPNILIQAVSGDSVQLTITYNNQGNTTRGAATITLSWMQWFTSIGAYNGNIGTLPFNSTWTLIITWIVGPKNYISFTPIARLSYNADQSLTDSVTIQEPLVCGDGLITQNEQCDTEGNLGVLFSGQVCENQQGVCVLRTDHIINRACINYQYTNNLGITTTGQACDEVMIPLVNASCSIMTGAAPVATNNGYDVNLTCRASNATATTPIIIDCGNGTNLVWWGLVFNGTCRYTWSFVGNAQCKVANDVNNPLCSVPISINAGQCKSLTALDWHIAIVDWDNNAESRFRCETINGNTAQKISIDCGNSTPLHTAFNASVLEATCEYTNVITPHPYNVRCLVDDVFAPVCQENIIVDEGGLWYCGDGVREGYEDCDEWIHNGMPGYACSKWCDLWGSMMGCFNVGNTSISIQKWEILPFRWTLDYKQNIIHGNSCNGQAERKIPEDSIMCTFNVYNGEHTEANWDPVFTIVKKCNTDDRNNAPIFNYFLSQWWRSLTNSFGRYALNTNDFVDDVFWEYKLSLDKVSYNYCLWWNQEVGTEIDRVCNVDFAVTQQYLAQKSSFGLTPKATTIPLDGYKMIDGTELINSTDLANIMVLNESQYDWGSAISTMMDSFINKYSKLAVKQGTKTSIEGNEISVYKVPGQDIVVFKGAGTLNYTDWSTKNKPFTVILDGLNIQIDWSIENSNAMFLLNKWNITFLPSADACTKTQVIKWIFITNQWSFLAGPDLTNDTINKSWCNFGWLKVQGILIWNGIDSLVQSRRSQLNGWFYVWWTSDAAIRAERRNEIFNGASVLIEYSPSLWNALPPWASEFTKALDIYKQ